MRILILGGTYFLGKAFAALACRNHDITLLNRGTRAVQFEGVKPVRQITLDRHQLTPGCLAQEAYDVVVDFCAYEKGDIRQAVEALAGKPKQYVFISTSDVYKRGTGAPVDETGELETRDFGGAAGAYILGKVALERELQEVAAEKKIAVTSVRPPFLYGPDNYAQRESIFFNWIAQAGQILYPGDATGSFQMVYVEDAAKAVLDMCGNPACYNVCFNLCGSDRVTYEGFCHALSYATRREFERVEISVEEVLQRQIPLPFPLTREESECYVTGNEALLHIAYRDLQEGLRLTYEWWAAEVSGRHF